MSLLEEAKKHPKKSHSKLSDEDTIELVFALIAHEIDSKSVLHALRSCGYKVNKGANRLTILSSRLLTLLRQGKLKLVKE